MFFTFFGNSEQSKLWTARRTKANLATLSELGAWGKYWWICRKRWIQSSLVEEELGHFCSVTLSRGRWTGKSCNLANLASKLQCWKHWSHNDDWKYMKVCIFSELFRISQISPLQLQVSRAAMSRSGSVEAHLKRRGIFLFFFPNACRRAPTLNLEVWRLTPCLPLSRFVVVLSMFCRRFVVVFTSFSRRDRAPCNTADIVWQGGSMPCNGCVKRWGRRFPVDNSLPLGTVPSKSVKQECPFKSVQQVAKSVQQGVQQECQTRVSRKSVLLKASTKV